VPTQALKNITVELTSGRPAPRVKIGAAIRNDNRAPPYNYWRISSLISYNRDPDYCILKEDRNPVRKYPQQILVVFAFMGSLKQRVPFALRDL